MENKKDIIDEIVEKLKNQSDLSYREGAWEKFQQLNTSVQEKKVFAWKRWASVAAAALIFGAGTVYFLRHDKGLSLENDKIVAIDKISNKESSQNPQHKENLPSIIEQSNSVSAQQENTSEFSNPSHVGNDLLYSLQAVNGVEVADFRNNLVHISNKNLQSVQPQLRGYSFTEAIEKLSDIDASRIQHVLTSSQQIAFNSQKEITNTPQNRNYKFSNKFDLSLFVSPSFTSEKAKVGGGFLVSYNLSKKISVRTGLSYNSYEVGQLKNPYEESSQELVALSNTTDYSSPGYNDYASVDKSIAYLARPASSEMLLPNINAVTGFVNALEVPVEVKYNVNKSLYFSAGASYANVTRQGREAHYTTSKMDPQNYNGQNLLNEKEKLEMVTHTVKSAQKNVNTDGFNGFVNFSVGKKIDVKNKFGLAIEPYVKLPVGQFQKADMDYTNGGIRIMTNF